MQVFGAIITVVLSVSLCWLPALNNPRTIQNECAICLIEQEIMYPGGGDKLSVEEIAPDWIQKLLLAVYEDPRGPAGYLLLHLLPLLKTRGRRSTVRMVHDNLPRLQIGDLLLIVARCLEDPFRLALLANSLPWDCFEATFTLMAPLPRVFMGYVDLVEDKNRRAIVFGPRIEVYDLREGITHWLPKKLFDSVYPEGPFQAFYRRWPKSNTLLISGYYIPVKMTRDLITKRPNDFFRELDKMGAEALLSFMNFSGSLRALKAKAHLDAERESTIDGGFVEIEPDNWLDIDDISTLTKLAVRDVYQELAETIRPNEVHYMQQLVVGENFPSLLAALLPYLNKHLLEKLELWDAAALFAGRIQVASEKFEPGLIPIDYLDSEVLPSSFIKRHREAIMNELKKNEILPENSPTAYMEAKRRRSNLAIRKDLSLNQHLLLQWSK